MTPTEKQKCIAEQWIYGLKVHGMGCFDTDTEETYVMKIVDMDITNNNLRAIVIIHDDIYGDEDTSYLSVEEEISPILRPLSDLTKEITHKEYNDDKPFIPLVELERLNAIPVDNTERALRYYDLLHLWHFDTRKLIATGEAISTYEVNPYEV